MESVRTVARISACSLRLDHSVVNELMVPADIDRPQKKFLTLKRNASLAKIGCF